MGDRAMAEIKTDEGSLYFYTHWYGYELPEHARAAMKKAEPRAGDYAYATRIVLDHLILASNSRDQETGTGVMLKPNAEDEYNRDRPSVVIDLTNGEVTALGRHNESDEE